MSEQVQEAMEREAKLTVVAKGDSLQIEAEGDNEMLVYCGIAALRSVAKALWDSAPSEMDAEMIRHELQETVKPTAKIWDMGGED